MTEDEMLKLALEQSMKSYEDPVSSLQDQNKNPDPNYDDLIMKTIMEMSKTDFNSGSGGFS